jgi:protein-tyrosine phosphatase
MDDLAGNTDLHIHLLPGLDDGPADMEGSLALLAEAWKAGTRRFCATPHAGEGQPAWERADAERLAGQLSARAAAAGFPAEIRWGAETALSPEILEQGKAGRLVTLGGSRYLLLETPGSTLPPGFADFLFRFRATGLVPVLAHPERCEELQRDPKRMRPLIASGALVQITAGSLCGEAGRSAKKASSAFLKEGWVHAIASDGHGDPPRLLDLSEAARAAEAILGDGEKAVHLVTLGPWRLMGGGGEARGTKPNPKSNM